MAKDDNEPRSFKNKPSYFELSEITDQYISESSFVEHAVRQHEAIQRVLSHNFSHFAVRSELA